MLKIPGKLPSRAQSTVVLKNIIYIYIYIYCKDVYMHKRHTSTYTYIYIYILLRGHFGSNAACTTVLACEHRTWWLHGSRRGGSRHRHGHPCGRAAYRRGSLSSRRIGLPAKSGPGLQRTSSGRPPGPGCLHRRSVRLRRTCGRRAPWVSTRRTTGECRRPCRRMKCGNLEKGTIGSKQARHGPPLRNQRWR
jgi:hypothetical protein